MHILDTNPGTLCSSRRRRWRRRRQRCTRGGQGGRSARPAGRAISGNYLQPVRLAGGWRLVLVCSERKVQLTGDWFVLREKYCWLIRHHKALREHGAVNKHLHEVVWVQMLKKNGRPEIKKDTPIFAVGSFFSFFFCPFHSQPRHNCQDILVLSPEH
jgi:hypothetical protein